jgi:hypothetical protein
MLKFEGKFEKGDVIKAFDFMPMDGRPDSFIIGKIIETDCVEHGYKSYKVVMYKHVINGKEYADEVGDVAWIPHEVSFMEYDNRITLAE